MKDKRFHFESHPNACCFDEESFRLRQDEFSHRVVVQILFDDTEYVQRRFLKYTNNRILRYSVKADKDIYK